VNVLVYQLAAKMVNNSASVLVRVSQKIMAAQNMMLLWIKQSFLELKIGSTHYLQNNKTVSSYLISHHPVYTMLQESHGPMFLRLACAILNTMKVAIHAIS